MKQIYTIGLSLALLLLTGSGAFAQADCNVAVPACNLPNFETNSSGSGEVDDLPFGNDISNPQNITTPAGNSGCLNSDELNPTWLIMSVAQSGFMQFSLGEAGGSGFYDWAMWPYTETTCEDIQNNVLPPAACNWNGSSAGFTGMCISGSLPAGANSSNFENAIPVIAGERYIICFSNFSGLVGANVPITTGPEVNGDPNAATISCEPFIPDYTVCEGSSVNVVVQTPGLTAPQFQWLVVTGVSDPTSGNVTVTTPVTTNYIVQVTEPALGGSPEQTWELEFTITVVPEPEPNAGPDQTICLGSSVQLAGVKSNAGNTANWQVIVPTGMVPAASAGFAPNANSMTATSTPNQPGIYRYILRETNAVCGTRRDTMVLTVSNVTLTATPGHPLCNGSSDGTITINSIGAVQYSFDNGATWVANSTQGGFAAGTYNVCARNAQGCQRCVSVTLTNPAAIMMTASNDTTICQNGTATLTAAATGGTGFTYTWDQTTDNGATQSFNPAGTTTYSVFATNANGCSSAPEPITVTVREPITGIISPPQSVCPGYSTNIDAAAMGGLGAPYMYVWSTGDNYPGMASSIPVSPTTNTTYTVTVTDGCESTPLVLSTDVMIYQLPVPSFDVIDGELCEPAQFVLYNTTTPENLVDMVTWRVAGQEGTDPDTLKPDPLYQGQYGVTMIVTSTDGCIDSVTVPDFLTVYPQPIPDFKWSPDPVKMFNTEVHFSNYSNGGVSYEWTFEEGSPAMSSSEDPTTKFPDGVAGTYEVMLVAESEFGCTDTVYKNVIVAAEVLLFAPNAFTPDGDEFNQTWRVFLEGVDPYNYQLLIFNRWGEIIFESKDIEASWDGTYHGQVLPAGTYKWTISAKDQLTDGKYEWAGDVNIIR